MSLSLWNRVDPFFGYDDMDRFFNTSLARTGGTGENALWKPSVDVKETDKEYLIHAELPGVKKEDINIDLEKNLLTISGERKQEKKEDNEKYHRVERSYGKFSRSMSVPEGVTPDQIKAKFDNGVLEVSFPKLEGKKETKKITIG